MYFNFHSASLLALRYGYTRSQHASDRHAEARASHFDFYQAITIYLPYNRAIISSSKRCPAIQRKRHARRTNICRESTSDILSNAPSVCLEIDKGRQRLILVSYFNNTWIYNATADFCESGTTEEYCTTYRGGLYDASSSFGAQLTASVDEAGGDSSDTQRVVGPHIWDYAFAIDKLSVSNVTLADYPIGMPGSEQGELYDTQHNFGLGINSTILNGLHAAGEISSRSYSWWWGQTGATEDTQMDGSLVLGGRDEAKTIGKGYTKDLILPEINCPSGMRVTVSDLVLNFPNGTTASILGLKQYLACLWPDFSSIGTLPKFTIYPEFEALTSTKNVGTNGGGGINAMGYLYPPDDVYVFLVLIRHPRH